MIGPPAGVRVYLAAGVTDMRKGFDGLAALVQQRLRQDPFGGAVYAFRGKRGDLVKLLWWDGQGLVLHAKRLERGRFTWPATADGVAVLTPAQLQQPTIERDGRGVLDLPRFSGEAFAQRDAVRSNCAGLM